MHFTFMEHPSFVHKVIYASQYTVFSAMGSLLYTFLKNYHRIDDCNVREF